MVGTDVVMEVMVEVVVVEAVDVVRVDFFVFSRCCCLGDKMDVKVVMEVVVGVVEVVCRVRMGVAVGCVRTGGEGVVSRGGGVSVADDGGARWKDCCRFPDEIFRELWEGLPYHLSFMLNIGNIFL